MFFVKKKDGNQRMIADCRRSNEWFTNPPATALFSSGGMVNVDASSCGDLFFGGFDVSNAFFQHMLPHWLRDLFCLPSLTAGELGLPSLCGAALAASDRIYP